MPSLKIIKTRVLIQNSLLYRWVPYTRAPNPCELNCMPHGERFYYRQKTAVVDGTRCNDESFDVCVNGTCQPVGCDMMLGSSAKEDKCRHCRGNGVNCHTLTGLLNTQDLVKGMNFVNYHTLFFFIIRAQSVLCPSGNFLSW